MKKGLLTFIAASAFCLGANAQYVMKVTKSNGEVAEFSADEVLNVTFDKGELSDRTKLITGVRSNLQAQAMQERTFSATMLNNAILASLIQVLTPEVIAQMQQDATAKVQERVKTVEPGSELSKYGFQDYVEVNPKDFDGNYTFTSDGKLVKAAADQLEITFPFAFAEGTEIPVTVIIKANGNTVKQALPYLPKIRERKRAMVWNIPESFNIKMNAFGTTVFDGNVDIKYEKKSQSEYVSLLSDKWTVSGSMNSHVKGLAAYGLADDENTVSFSRSFDSSTGAIASSVGVSQNGQSIYERSGKVTIPAVPKTLPMLQQLLPLIMSIPAETSIKDLAGAAIAGLLADKETMQNINIDNLLFGLLAGSTIDEAKVTVFGDLTITGKVSDVAAVMKLQKEITSDRRSRKATKETIQAYVDELNKNVELKCSFKGIEKELPMQVIVCQVGVDYWAVPAVKFADEERYTPIVELLDIKSMNYLINIASHCVQPLTTSVAVLGSTVTTLANLYLGMVQAQQEQQEQ